jgi:hypothetical protein
MRDSSLLLGDLTGHLFFITTQIDIHPGHGREIPRGLSPGNFFLEVLSPLWIKVNCLVYFFYLLKAGPGRSEWQ